MKNKSIDDATPEEWNRLNNSSKRELAWLDEEDSTEFDSVHKPEHYNNSGLECIDAIKGMLTPDEYIGYLRGNSLKYLWRFRYKNKPIEDLRKARWYEERLISYMLEHPSDK
ncbi:MAG: hypothetical protein CBD88_08360 [Flavobacteriales bacterium TMED228]|nr:MAG: hypothetical protein CBD88_08360 [Flavobacteriales bacterium TMED228]|tara:strand:- start:1017 stop:1352 length:336 start_codon:yes stop_codon:yes gene_type:complete